jgi:hypothetical protein
MLRLLGEASTQALFLRSLTRAKAAPPGFTAAATEPLSRLLPRLFDALQAEGPAAAADAIAAAQAALSELLAAFLGVELTARLLADAWSATFHESSAKERLAEARLIFVSCREDLRALRRSPAAHPLETRARREAIQARADYARALLRAVRRLVEERESFSLELALEARDALARARDDDAGARDQDDE